ncbi:nitrogen fixation protein NifQ [Azorhizobium sp. AG788]|uniref:nitrogen fixation protein NifQ n=1 Tax=Azorhizobium sp. AG788 TaxID=2183897 RepID=UPI00313A36AB
MAPHAGSLDPVPPAPSRTSAAAAPAVSAADAYRRLTGTWPERAVISDDGAFDRHVLASILAVSATEGDALAAHCGLDPADLATVLSVCFSTGDVPPAWRAGSPPASPDAAMDDEAALVRDLLLARRSTAGDMGRWLAAMLARRAMAPNHLWEDLGLRDRSELTRLMARHFGPLAARNANNMRWKRFFYRMMCEDDGFVMCATPVCTQCADFDLCFGDESGESRMADRRRTLALGASSAAPSSSQ